MLYFLSGNDPFRLFERKRLIEQEFFQRFPEGEKFVFDGEESWDESTRSLLSEALSSGGLFATPHFVCTRGLETLDERSGEWLVECLKTKGEMVTGVLIYRLAPRKKLPAWWQALAQHGQGETFEALTTTDRQRLIETTVSRMGATIESAAARYVGEAFPKDAGRLVQEVSRLSLMAPGAQITLEIAKREIALPREQAVFSALDSLIRGDRARAVALFRHEETEPDAPFALLGLCTWQVRRLITVKELFEQEKMATAAIAKELKTSAYPIQKTLPLLPKLSFARLRQALILLAEFDQRIKTGRLRPGVALDLFVWKF